jgi:hypothetical protein
MSAFISSTDNVYIFNNLGIFVTNSFCTKINSAGCLKRISPNLTNLTTSALARGKVSFRDTVVSSRTFKINKMKICRSFRSLRFLWILSAVYSKQISEELRWILEDYHCLAAHWYCKRCLKCFRADKGKIWNRDMIWINMYQSTEVNHKQFILNLGYIKPTKAMVTGKSLMIHAYNNENKPENKVCFRILKVNVDSWALNCWYFALFCRCLLPYQRFYTCHELLLKPVKISSLHLGIVTRKIRFQRCVITRTIFITSFY